MQKYTLTSVQRYQKTSAAGKPYTSLVVKTNTHGDRMLSGFGNKDNESWKPGDEVEFDVEEKGQYLNFSTPKNAPRSGGVDDHTKARIEQIYQEVYAIRMEIVMVRQLLQEKGIIPTSSSPVGIPYTGDDLDPSSVPF